MPELRRDDPHVGPYAGECLLGVVCYFQRSALLRNGSRALRTFGFTVVIGIGLVDRGQGSRFTLESFQGLRIPRKFFWQEFQGDTAAQSWVLCLIDNAHTAAAQAFENSVGRNGLANHGAFEYSKPRVCVNPP